MVRHSLTHPQAPGAAQQAMDGVIELSTTFHSPFDNLFWAKGRDLQFWGYNTEAYSYKEDLWLLPFHPTMTGWWGA
jgi:hypothetical protein